MLPRAILPLALLVALYGGQPSPRLTLWLRGLPVGFEETRGTTGVAGTALVARTKLSVGAEIDLTGTISKAGGAVVALDVHGSAPGSLAARTEDRALSTSANAFPIQSPFPVQMIAELVRHSLVTGERRFTTLMNETAVVEECPAAPDLLRGATCHLVSGLTWGVVQIWLDDNKRIAAAAIPTPWGLVQVTTSRSEGRRERLLDHFARSAAARLRARVGPPAVEEVLVFANIRIIDPADGSVRTGSVVVKDGTIAAVGAHTGSWPSGAHIVDGTGMSLLPGLWDMHAHLKQADWGPAYLAAGVTSARDVGNDPAFILALRDAEREGIFPSPQLWTAAFIDAAAPHPHTAVQANTIDQGTKLVRHFADAGFDQIKLWSNVPRHVTRAIVEEAHRRGLKVTRHAPSGAEALASIKAGVDHIDHLFALLEAADGDLDSPSGRALLAQLRSGGVAVDPTLVVTEFASRSTALPLSAIETGALKAPAFVVRAWSAFGQPPERASPEPLRRAGRFVRQLHEAGVPIVAGSDQGVPGYTLLREVELFTGAGLTPMEALAAATWIPAQVMGVSDRLGRIRPGYRADLVVVEGNPARSVRDLRRVRYVIKSGRLFEPAPLWRSVGFQP